MSEIDAQLIHQADVESRNRKRLRPNKLAEWALRIDEFRVFYDIVHISIVKVVAIGHKEGSTLHVHGEEYQL